jgi:hypothetical protein
MTKKAVLEENGEAIARPTTSVQIAPLDMRIVTFNCVGTAHIAVNRVSQKVREDITAAQAEGGTSKSRKKRDPKNFEALCTAAAYRSSEGWYGIHAASIRCAMISACRTVGYKMTLAKLGIFTKADGYDAEDNTPLIRIWGVDKDAAVPHMWIAPVRNASGVFDLRPRPRWHPGEWSLRPSIRYDAGLFTLQDVTNLMQRVGAQVGLAEGRPDSKNSAGLEYGLFDLRMEAQKKAA